MRPDTNPEGGVTGREFLTTAAGAGLLLGAAAAAPSAPGQRESAGSSRRRRYALVGVGGRSGIYREAVLEPYAAHCEMVGCCDGNAGRLKLAQDRDRQAWGVTVPLYAARDFDRMARETRPDTVIVTTKDSAHSDYIVRAMELGCDVITEKPMTTDEKKCRAILKTQRRTGRNCRVTFNYRYSPPRV
jgi:predicted dehydrogenase